MAFDHVDYVSNHPLPAERAWAANFSWLNLVLVSDTEMRVTNRDGSITVFRGTGFTLDEHGVPDEGLVRSVERYDASRTTLLERIAFRDGELSGDTDVSAFVHQGFDSWIFEGDDNYRTKAGVLIHEYPGHGIDTVTLTSSPESYYYMAPDVENLVYDGTKGLLVRANDLANHVVTGSGSDTLVGAGGNDILDGGAGNDVMTGGLGDDTFIVDHAGDKANELAAQGNDTVHTTLTAYTLLQNVENVRYVGSATATLTGNTLANVLQGGAGADKLVGGQGNDTYVADTLDTIVEQAGQGIDTVKTIAGAYTLGANVENLVFFRADPTTKAIDHTGTGNTLDNRLVGDTAVDTLYGGAGNDTFEGGEDAVADQLYGGTGNDTYILKSAGGVQDAIHEAKDEGIDTVISYLFDTTLADNVENLNLEGSQPGLRSAIGNSIANTITGTYGNDRMDGRGGVDTLRGSHGDDTYVIDETNDVIIEGERQGTDTVETSRASYTLGNYLENLRFTVDAVSHTGTGNAAANEMFGAAGADKLLGMGGDDLIDGGAGADTLLGGLGNDTYVVDQAGDVVTESSGQGTDTVKTGLAAYTLGANLENLVFERADPIGTAAVAHVGTGNALSNVIKGDAESDTLHGEAGHDTLDGGELYDPISQSYTTDGVADTLHGGLGNDTFIVRDESDLAVELSGQGTDTVVSYAGHYVLGDHIENAVINDNGEVSRSIVGNALKNTITGGGSDDWIDGGAGNDIMSGGDGDDTYVVDAAGDQVLELASQGNDSVLTSLASFTIGTSVENLYFLGAASHTGKGNESANVIGGGSGIDTLYGLGGNDTLAGGLDGKADKLYGGAGNDTYLIGETIDTIVEGAGEGTMDTVVADFDYTLGTGLEGFKAAAHSGTLKATGNAANNWMAGNYGLESSGSETFYGLAGNDILDSGHVYDKNDVEHDDLAVDTLYGGTGNDTYIVWDHTRDHVIELANEGVDTVISYALNATLAANVENLELVGHDQNDLVFATGNALNNSIKGGTSVDWIDGGAGNDIMAGGLGNDTYVVDAAGDVVTEAAGGGVDTVLTSTTKYTLATNVENVVGTSLSAQELTGNELANVMKGGSGADKLQGLAGDDIYLAGTGDVVIEAASGGTDLVMTALKSYALTNNVENLAYYVEDPDLPHQSFKGTGNALANRITGGDAGDALYGLSGNDRLEGARGDDKLIGGAGNDLLSGDVVSSDGNFTDLAHVTIDGLTGDDIFFMTSGDGRDEVLDFRGAATGGGDRIAIHGVAAFDDFADVQAAMTQTAAGVRIDIDANTSMMLKGLAIADLGASDFIFTAP